MSTLFDRADATRTRLRFATTPRTPDENSGMFLDHDCIIHYAILNGWTFLAFYDEKNERLLFRVGCRYFTLKDARKHWKRGRNRYNEPRGEILTAVEAAAKIAKLRYGKTGR